MGKKGSKRKTRWRTLSIGAPPGEEDEEEGLRNGFVNGQENDTSTHSFSRNEQSGGYKSCRTRSSDDGGGYTGGGARHNESSGSPSQPKIIFNEDEYTRITTPRQDMLFKKGYLSRKKPWARNANTSATSSTTESQSASHSTADGSETTEDQQLLDRDCTTGEYSPMMDSGAQLGYGAFYDHANSYFYEYPVMLVGPAPIPTESNILTAVPCAPVPLRPIEWVSPAFVPKLTGQPYCMMNYKTNQSTESTVVMEEQENTMLPMDNANGTCNESGTGSASCSGSVAGETEKQSIEFNNSKEEQHADEQLDKPIEDQYKQQVEEQPLENGLNGGPYFQPMLMQQPVHVSHVIPAVPQPYMYPGHYMFGPPFINVNGVTIQGGPMIRTMDFAAMSTACAKRRKKYKRRKQRRLAAGNTEDEEEGEYSSEGDTGVTYSRMPWTACSTSTTTTTTTSNWPLNPECREFQLQQVVEPHTSLSTVPTSTNTLTSEESSTVNQQSSTLSPDVITSVDNENNEPCNGLVSDDSKNPNDESITDSKTDQQVASASTLIENNESTSLNTANNSDDEANRLTNCLPGDEEAVPSTNEVVNETTEMEKLPSTTKAANNNSSSANEPCERPSNEMMNGGETLVNGKLDSDSNNEDNMMMTTTRTSSPQKDTRSRSVTPKSVENVGNREKQNHESLASSKSSSSTSLSKRKYSAKGSKFVREPTPGPDLDNTTEPENETKIHDLTHSLDKMNLSNDSKQNIMFDTSNDKTTEGEQVSDKLLGETMCNHVNREDPVESMNEDSGFESQTRLSDYPITEAVTEWLRRANSPDMFITPTVSMDCEEDEDEDDVDEEPPKNLQGNPMPALSANSGVDNTLSRTASYSEFARISNIKGGQEQQQQQPDSNNSASRKKKDPKRRSEERRRVVRHTMDGKLDHEVVSSSDSCGQLEDPMNIARRKNPARQQQQQQQPQQQQQDVVDNNCEFTEKDSVAGMRVALSSRMDSKRVNARRTKRQGRSHPRDPVNNIDTKIRRIEDVDDENDEGIVKDTMNVRTFEKGEIVVSKSGKLLTTSVYEASLRNRHDASTVIKTIGKNETSKQKNEKKTEESKRSSSDEEEESASGIGSLDSIEEPDVLECWEAEVIEPVITPKRMLQSEGVLCEGEAAEDDTIEVEQVNIDYVQKYYRLARESASSVEEKMNLKANPSSASLKSVVPNKSEQMEEVQTHKELDDNNDNIPIDEAFEVYESCYTGKAPFLSIDSKVFKPRTLYGQDGETPIPCRAVCCNLQ